MKKPELIAAVADQAELSKAQAAKAVNAIVETITQAVSKGEDVSLIGFGSFQLRKRAARNGHNPQTGKSIKIPASKSVAFKAGKSLREAVNN
ncbi:DNA-binding protein HU [Pelagibaculum spongiae]|uniref:DNA-binding protein HU n=1 Tax=Pelagibaculum spongiae TaxID=2080658 RepID=A0A2V1GZG3_9GAMM|nr:DNA-binding protein HU [Pelagibaculum spongiae]